MEGDSASAKALAALRTIPHPGQPFVQCLKLGPSSPGAGFETVERPAGQFGAQPVVDPLSIATILEQPTATQLCQVA